MSRPDDVIEMPAPDPDDPRLACLIQYLEPSARGLKACRQLRVRTVRDFLARDRDDFIGLRNCGERTYADLVGRIHRFLATREENPATPSADDLDKPLLGLVQNPRAERAFLALGITTVGEFLNTPKEVLLQVKGFGERTYYAITQRIREVTSQKAQGLRLLPDSLLTFPVGGLGLPPKLGAALDALSVPTVHELLDLSGDLLRKEPAIGEAGIQSIREALDRLVRVGRNRTLELAGAGQPADFYAVVAQILSVLDEDQAAMFRQRIGLDCPPKTLRAIAFDLEIGEEQAHILAESTRLALRERAPALLARLHEEAEREIRAFEGMLHSETLAPGTLLHSAAHCTGDPQLPLRLLQFCFAREYYLHGDLLTRLPPKSFRKLRRVLRNATGRDKLPVPVAEVAARAARVVSPVPTGLMMHLLEHREQLRVQLDGEHGEILHRGATSVPDRLFELLVDLAEPTSAEDLLFHYRDRHHRGNLHRLLDHLRADPRFIEVGKGVWNVRNKHLDELAAARPEAESIVEVILAQHRRQSVFSLHSRSGLPERKTYMVIECLRQDPRVRFLGQGIFCPRSTTSAVMEEIKEAMRRAMGELVYSRFLDNQHDRRRRLVECLLDYNRAFVSPSPDRVDLLTNYPFNAERMARLRDLIDAALNEGRGYAHATDLLEKINATDLGGSWLTEHMLLDLLRRNMDFELLPAGIIAQRHLGLAGWIQHRARECLRQADEALSPEGLLADDPELGAFAECIQDLLEQDPMVQCVDGQRYVIV